MALLISMAGLMLSEDDQDRPKNLLPGDGHVVADVAEHRGLDDVASVEPLRPPSPTCPGRRPSLREDRR